MQYSAFKGSGWTSLRAQLWKTACRNLFTSHLVALVWNLPCCGFPEQDLIHVTLGVTKKHSFYLERCVIKMCYKDTAGFVKNCALSRKEGIEKEKNLGKDSSWNRFLWSWSLSSILVLVWFLLEQPATICQNCLPLSFAGSASGKALLGGLENLGFLALRSVLSVVPAGFLCWLFWRWIFVCPERDVGLCLPQVETLV